MIKIIYDYDHKTLEDSLWIQILLEIRPAQHLPTSLSNFIIWGFTPKKMVYKGKSPSNSWMMTGGTSLWLRKHLHISASLPAKIMHNSRNHFRSPGPWMELWSRSPSVGRGQCWSLGLPKPKKRSTLEPLELAGLQSWNDDRLAWQNLWLKPRLFTSTGTSKLNQVWECKDEKDSYNESNWKMLVEKVSLGHLKLWWREHQ